MSRTFSASAAGGSPSVSTQPEVSQNWRKVLPRWSVGYSRQSSSRANSWLTPTMYASMKGWFWTIREIVLGGMSFRLGTKKSAEMSRSGSYIGFLMSGYAIAGTMRGVEGSASPDASP